MNGEQAVVVCPACGCRRMNRDAPCHWCAWRGRFVLNEGHVPYPDGLAYGIHGHDPTAGTHTEEFYARLYLAYERMSGAVDEAEEDTGE